VLLVDEMAVERQHERPLIELELSRSMIRHRTPKLRELSAKKVYAPNSGRKTARVSTTSLKLSEYLLEL
jgi:hypothetical protein